MNKQRQWLWLWSLCLLLLPLTAFAHKPSDSYLFLSDQADGKPALQWDIALRDLERAIGLDLDRDGKITWGEVRQQQTAIKAYALSHLQVQQAGSACQLHTGNVQTDTHTDGAYVVLPIGLGCRWQPVATFRPALGNLLKVITAFTVAHSITLSLAVLEVVVLPSRWVESAIALSIIVLAANILYPIITHAQWKLAFGFGLLHGFGFASVLLDLGMERVTLVEALVGFNIGVELGQLLMVLPLFPLGYVLRHHRFYRVQVLHGSAVLTLLLASVWLAERAFNLSFA